MDVGWKEELKMPMLVHMRAWGSKERAYGLWNTQTNEWRWRNMTGINSRYDVKVAS